MLPNLNETDAGDRIESLEALIQVLAGPDCGLARVRGSRVRNGTFLAWLETQAGLEAARLARIQALFKRQSTNPSLFLFALRYTLTPDAPLELSPGLAVRSPAELAAALLGVWPNIEGPLNALSTLAASGRLPEWLRASEPVGWQEAVHAIEFARTHHPSDLELSGWALLWAYGAKSPFPFNGRLLEMPPDLARAINASDSSREEGLRHLDAGWIRTWLITTGRLADPTAWDAAVQDTEIAPPARLAAALLRLDPDRPAPTLRATPGALDFGIIRRNEQRQLQLRLDTLHRESVACSLSLQDTAIPIALNVTHLEATPATIQVSVGDRGLAAGQRVETAILVHGSGAVLRVPVRFRVAASATATTRRFSPAVIIILLAGAGGLGWWYMSKPAPHRLPPATATLAQQAEQQRQTGDLSGAAATLEHSLKIAPRDSYLWNQLATVRLQQGLLPQASQLAARANDFAEPQSAIAQDNLRIIAESRQPPPTVSLPLSENNVSGSVPPPARGTEETAYVNTILLNVRDGPGPDYASLTKVPQGTAIRVLERRSVGDDALWARIDVQGVSGWVNAKLLSATPVASTNTDPTPPLNVSNPIHLSPSFNCAAATKQSESAICRDAALVALDNDLAALYRTRRQGLADRSANNLRDSQRHWLTDRDNCGSDVACLAASYRERIVWLQNFNASQPVHPPATAAGETAYVNTILLNMRDGPGPDYPSLTKLPQGTAIRILERRTMTEGAVWARIESNGVSGWANAKMLGATPGNTATNPAPAPMRVNSPRDGFLALRSEPSAQNGFRLEKIPHGTELTLGECKTTPTREHWCQTRYLGKVGWVLDRYVKHF